MKDFLNALVGAQVVAREQKVDGPLLKEFR
jgi:hypothetical protein